MNLNRRQRDRIAVLRTARVVDGDDVWVEDVERAARDQQLDAAGSVEIGCREIARPAVRRQAELGPDASDAPAPFAADSVAPAPAKFSAEVTMVASTDQPDEGPRTPDLTPMIRAQLHETLEKVAWEAFADVSDTVVQQVIKKIESIAWEVIPQMAETMIQEEIRRMKDKPE